MCYNVAREKSATDFTWHDPNTKVTFVQTLFALHYAGAESSARALEQQLDNEVKTGALKYSIRTQLTVQVLGTHRKSIICSCIHI